MKKRTLKPAAGQSKISQREATAAARFVYRDRRTGRFVILERGESHHQDLSQRRRSSKKQ
jgi:hypothetical protein